MQLPTVSSLAVSFSFIIISKVSSANFLSNSKVSFHLGSFPAFSNAFVYFSVDPTFSIA